VPEVDRVFVCVLSTLALQAPPPKGDRRAKDRRTVASPHSVVANGIYSCPPPSPTVPPPPREDINILSTLPLRVLPPKGDRKAKDRNTPPRPAKLSTPQEGNFRTEAFALLKFWVYTG
jgi:hypothetical protein